MLSFPVAQEGGHFDLIRAVKLGAEFRQVAPFRILRIFLSTNLTGGGFHHLGEAGTLHARAHAV